MSYIECFLMMCAFGAGIGVVFGVLYPLAMVAYYKITKSGLTVREILKRI